MVKLDSLTLPNMVGVIGAAYKELPALTTLNGTVVSYQGLGRAAASVARRLVGHGIAPGDRVALLAENRPEWGLAYFGISCAGAVVVPILTDFNPEQIRNIMEHAGAKAVFTSAKTESKLSGVPDTVTRYLVEDLTADLGLDPTQAIGAEDAGFANSATPDDLAAIIYTSGTTGHSKGVMLSHRNMLYDAFATKKIIKIRTSDRLLSILPLAHTYEFTIGFLTPLLQGASITYLDRAPSATVLQAALASVRPTVMLSVPIIIEKVYRNRVEPALRENKAARNPLLKPLIMQIAGMKLKRSFGGKLRFFGIGGAALAGDVETFLRAAGFPYAIGYGLTETSPLVAGCGPKITRYRSTGPVLDGVEVRIAGAATVGDEGEIQVRGPIVMKGYYNDPEKTAQAFSEDGWFKTGDLGCFDKEGNLYVRGRIKSIILGSSGENIYPEEIESLINGTGIVEESLVVSGDNGELIGMVYLNEAIRTQLERIDPEAISEQVNQTLQNLRTEVNKRLSAFQRLARIVMRTDPFEKTPTQKIKRFLYSGSSAPPN